MGPAGQGNVDSEDTEQDGEVEEDSGKEGESPSDEELEEGDEEVGEKGSPAPAASPEGGSDATTDGAGKAPEWLRDHKAAIQWCPTDPDAVNALLDVINDPKLKGTSCDIVY